MPANVELLQNHMLEVLISKLETEHKSSGRIPCGPHPYGHRHESDNRTRVHHKWDIA